VTDTMAPTTHEVLVVEDDDDVREAVQLLIDGESDAAYAVHAAGARDGRAAMDWLRAHAPPCVILLDLMMPDVDGWQVLDWLHRDPALSQVPVVVLSAATPAGIRDAQHRHEVAGCLQKPCRAEDLLAEVARHCAGGCGR
jgi:CheY-like chemotaxis protein